MSLFCSVDVYLPFSAHLVITDQWHANQKRFLPVPIFYAMMPHDLKIPRTISVRGVLLH